MVIRRSRSELRVACTDAAATEERTSRESEERRERCNASEAKKWIGCCSTTNLDAIIPPPVRTALAQLSIPSPFFLSGMCVADRFDFQKPAAAPCTLHMLHHKLGISPPPLAPTTKTREKKESRIFSSCPPALPHLVLVLNNLPCVVIRKRMNKISPKMRALQGSIGISASIFRDCDLPST